MLDYGFDSTHALVFVGDRKSDAIVIDITALIEPAYNELELGSVSVPLTDEFSSAVEKATEGAYFTVNNGLHSSGIVLHPDKSVIRDGVYETLEAFCEEA